MCCEFRTNQDVLRKVVGMPVLLVVEGNREALSRRQYHRLSVRNVQTWRVDRWSNEGLSFGLCLRYLLLGLLSLELKTGHDLLQSLVETNKKSGRLRDHRRGHGFTASRAWGSCELIILTPESYSRSSRAQKKEELLTESAGGLIDP